VANVVAQHQATRRPAASSLDERDEHGALRFEPATLDRRFSDLEARDRLEKALATLPVPYRLVLASHYFEGMAYEELAHALDLPLGTIKTHLFRARRLLRARLTGDASRVRE
jgi:RNA polymerase sigma-70 factor (ECF subfamily)